jgi:hypothetical protein
MAKRSGQPKLQATQVESKVLLREGVLLKDNGELGLLVLDIASDAMFRVKGDVATMLIELEKQTQKRSGATVEHLQAHLKAISPKFRANPDAQAVLLDALDYFRNIGIIENGG